MQFDLGGKVIKQLPYGNGHINDTYLLTIQRKMEQKVV